MDMNYEWKALYRVDATRPPFMVERVPYEDCPNCQRCQYRPVYDGRTGSMTRRCKECKLVEDAPDVSEPDRYVHDANAALADAVGIMMLLIAVGVLGALILFFLGVI